MSNQPIILEMKISLRDIHPRIERVFRVSDRITFRKLHEVIQIVMGWENYHLYEFRYGPYRIGIPDGEYFVLDRTHLDARDTRIGKIGIERNDAFTYQYDFGDDWQHTIEVQHNYRSFGGPVKPECIDGKQACPPEDVGGSSGYSRYLVELADPNNENHAQSLGWRGPFDANEFNLTAVNERLKRLR